MNYDLNNLNWMNDNDFMTYKQLIIRLRADLDEPDFFVYDLVVPHNEEEYSQVLSENKQILALIKQSSSKRNIPAFDKDALIEDLIKYNVISKDECQ